MKAYIKKKKSILKQFAIEITPAIEARLNACTNKIQADNYCRTLIMNRLA